MEIFGLDTRKDAMIIKKNKYSAITKKYISRRNLNEFYNSFGSGWNRYKSAERFMEELIVGSKLGKGDLVFGCGMTNEYIEEVYPIYGSGPIGSNCITDYSFGIKGTACGGYVSWMHCCQLPKSRDEVIKDKLIKLNESLNKCLSNKRINEKYKTHLEYELNNIEKLIDQFGCPSQMYLDYLRQPNEEV